MESAELIKVGNVSKVFNTIGVGLLLDYFDDKTSTEGTISEHFRMIDADGIFIVSVESFFLIGPPKIQYKGFTTMEDAYEYLEMYGVTDECKN